MLKTTLSIDVEAKKKFREFYPQNGALQWFLNECLRKFVQIHDPKVDLEIEDTVQRVTALGYKEESES
jgi:hypothetical protein